MYKDMLKLILVLTCVAVVSFAGCGGSGGSSSSMTVSNPFGSGAGVGTVRGVVFGSQSEPGFANLASVGSSSSTSQEIRSATVEDLVPVAGARVWLETMPSVSALSDANGAFLLEGVPAGSYRLIAKVKDAFGKEFKARSSHDLEINNSAQKQVDLTLLHATKTVVGRLLDIDGKELAVGTRLMIAGEFFSLEDNGRFETPYLPHEYRNLPLWVFVNGQPAPLQIPVTIPDNDHNLQINIQLPVAGGSFAEMQNWQLPGVYLYPELNGKFSTSIKSGDQLRIRAGAVAGESLDQLQLEWITSMGILAETPDPYTKVFSSANGGIAEVSVILSNPVGATGTIVLPIEVEGIYSAERQFHSFSFAGSGVISIIDEERKLIRVTVPFGTNVTSLVANFSASANATVKVGSTLQTSGVTANDFTAPVTYTVTAQNGETQQYVVTVSVAPNSANSLTSFAFVSPSVSGIIDEANNSIAVTVPFGTDVSSLVANFSASANATVKVGSTLQTSGVTANDFTASVTYTVTAQNGETQQYVVAVSVAPNSANSLTSFAFVSPSVSGIIDEANNSIAVIVPFGTDVSSLVANFNTSANATVKVGSVIQASGATANDFTAPVVYTVSAQNGETQQYVVTVSVAPNSANSLTSFAFVSPSVSGTIDEANNSIAATVPFGTDVSSLVANFSASANATVKVDSTLQTSGVTANDFTAPVTYTVTAQNGETQQYVVAVSVAPNSANSLTSFAFVSPSVTGTIDEANNSIAVTVPFGTDVSSLVANFSASANATVKVGSVIQASGATANDFTAPVVYTVTAQNGETQQYVVTVSVAPNSENTLTSFAFVSPSVSGTIDEANNSIAATVPFGTDVSSLVANFSASANATVKVGSVIQASGVTPNNFAAPVIYKVTAQSGETQQYVVTVSVAPNSANSLTSFAFVSPSVSCTIDEANNSIAATVPFGTDVSSLVANFSASANATVKVGSVIQASGATANDFTAPVVYTVTAQNGESRQCVVTVTIAPNSDNSLTSFAFVSPSVTGTIDEAKNSIAVTVPFGTDVSSLVANFSASANATVKVGSVIQASGATANDFTAPVVYTVTAQNGESRQYVVTVTIAPNSANSLTSFAFVSPSVSGTIDEANNSIAVTVPFGTDVSSLVANFSASANATVKVGSTLQASGATPNNFSSPVVYTVVAENGNLRNYLVSVMTELSSENRLTAFLFNSPAVAGTIDEGAGMVYLKVPFGTDVSNLVAHFSASPNSTVKIDSALQTSGVTANDFSTVLTYSVYAQNGDKKDFQVTVEVEVRVFVYYDGNGNTSGTVPVDDTQYEVADPITVAGNTGGLVKDNFYLDGWNSQSDGLGLSYPIGSVFNIGATDVTLFAKWSPCYVFDSTFGETGSGDGQFKNGYCCDCDASDNLYVADSANHRVQVFDSNGNFLRKWGAYGTGDGYFKLPVGIVVDAEGNVFVSDNYNTRVQKFDSNGNFILKWGSQGLGDGQFSSPAGISCDSLGNLFVCDVVNDRIQKFDNDGNFILGFGSAGSDPGQMSSAYSCVIDADDNVLVADTFNNRVQKFDNNGNFIKIICENLTVPLNITMNSNGQIFVAQTYNDRIAIFDSLGNHLYNLGQSGTGDGDFSYPTGLVVDSNHKLIVLEHQNNRIQKFVLP